MLKKQHEQKYKIDERNKSFDLLSQNNKKQHFKEFNKFTLFLSKSSKDNTKCKKSLWKGLTNIYVQAKKHLNVKNNSEKILQKPKIGCK